MCARASERERDEGKQDRAKSTWLRVIVVLYVCDRYFFFFASPLSLSLSVEDGEKKSRRLQQEAFIRNILPIGRARASVYSGERGGARTLFAISAADKTRSSRRFSGLEISSTPVSYLGFLCAGEKKMRTRVCVCVCIPVLVHRADYI